MFWRKDLREVYDKNVDHKLGEYDYLQSEPLSSVLMPQADDYLPQ